MSAEAVRVAKVIKRIEWDRRYEVIDCDFDHRNRTAALLKIAPGESRVVMDQVAQDLPKDWALQTIRIRWFDDSGVLLWPLSQPGESASSVGRFSSAESCILNIGRPLDVFKDRNVIACTYPEDQVSTDVPPQSDLGSIFSLPGFVRIARLIDPIMKDYSHVPILEVEHAVLDGANGRFWFTAYDVHDLWCYEFYENILTIAPLRCSLADVLAISCDNSSASVLIQRFGEAFVRTFVRNGEKLQFDAPESVLRVPAEMQDAFFEVALRHSGRMSGYPSGRFAVKSPSVAILAAI
jgi:hypothetical protein